MKTITTEDGQKVEISDESYASMVDAAREPIGEALLRSLPFGKYRINGRLVKLRKFGTDSTRIESIPHKGRNYSTLSACGAWFDKYDFERYISMKAADLRQHHIKPYTVEWRGMTRREILAFIAYYGKKIVSRSCNSDFWKPTTYHPYTSAIKFYSFAHIERDGAIGEPHKFRCTVDAPHKVEGTDYEF